MRKWLLPEAIDDVLPHEALQIEALRRVLLEHFRVRGYRLVQPPLVEFLDSLLTGSGRDLDLQTFKTVDPLSGRLVGVRADTTPQVARIDAHLLNEAGVTRLCYAGSVLRTIPAGPGISREVVQIGAELYGHAGIDADCEILRLLLSALAAARVRGLHLDLSHVALYRCLARQAGLPVNGKGDGEDTTGDLFTALRDKDLPAVRALTEGFAEPARGALRALPECYGPAAATIARARSLLPPLPEIEEALTALETLAHAAQGVAAIHVDLADLRGYHYHTGATFSVFSTDDHGAVIDCGRGGRYDGVGQAFGRDRAATGFTLDLRRLAALVGEVGARATIVAPANIDPALQEKIAALRATGETVVVALADERPAGNLALVCEDGVWRVVAR